MFSAIIGFSTIVNPLANYLLRYYAVAVVTLWATSFSLAVLFIPKLYIFFKQWKETRDKQKDQEEKRKRKESGISENTMVTGTSIVPPEGGTTNMTFLAFLKQEQPSFQPPTDASPFVYNEPDLVHPTATSGSDNVTEDSGRYDNTNVYVEVQEVFKA